MNRIILNCPRILIAVGCLCPCVSSHAAKLGAFTTSGDVRKMKNARGLITTNSTWSNAIVDHWSPPKQRYGYKDRDHAVAAELAGLIADVADLKLAKRSLKEVLRTAIEKWHKFRDGEYTRRDRGRDGIIEQLFVAFDAVGPARRYRSFSPIRFSDPSCTERISHVGRIAEAANCLSDSGVGGLRRAPPQYDMTTLFSASRVVGSSHKAVVYRRPCVSQITVNVNEKTQT